MPGYFDFYGILLWGVFNGFVEDNIMVNENPFNPAISYTKLEGVVMYSCSQVNIISNKITGFGAGYDKGLNVSNSTRSTIRCNLFENAHTGVRFEQGCGSTNLYGNNFRSTYQGVDLYTSGTVIGQQYKKYNTWTEPTAFILADARMFFDNYDPTDLGDIQQVKKSLFTIHTTNQSSDYWADPRLVGYGGPGQNDPNWFVGLSSPSPSVYLCPVEALDSMEPRLDFLERGIVDGTFIPWKGYAANTWDEAFLLFQKMSEDETLRPSGSPESSWFANNYNGILVSSNEYSKALYHSLLQSLPPLPPPNYFLI